MCVSVLAKWKNVALIEIVVATECHISNVLMENSEENWSENEGEAVPFTSFSKFLLVFYNITRGFAKKKKKIG